MSAEAFGWAWGIELPAVEKMVLLVVADTASPERSPHSCPADYIARTAGVDPVEAEAVIVRLIGKGLVRRSHGLYALALPPRPPKSEPEVRPGCVYVMRAGDKTKVGVSTDVQKRLLSIRATLPETKLVHSFPMPITEARKWEAACLKHFAAESLHGEWLSTRPTTVVDFLQQLTGQKGMAEHG